MGYQTIIPNSNDIQQLHHIHRNFLHFHNCRIVDPSTWKLSDANVIVDQTIGKIRSVHYNYELDEIDNTNIDDDNLIHSSQYIDCKGYILSPGFIDIQINGAFGIDFSNPNIVHEDVIHVAKGLVKYGVTSFCPTMVSSSPETYQKVISSIMGPNGRNSPSSQHHQNHEYSNILGMHLEGPFFAKSKRGAHAEQHIVESLHDQSIHDIYRHSVKNLYNAGVSIVTLAPELKGAMENIQTLKEQGIVVAMGHSDATMKQGMEGVRSGATLITHLYNAMKPFHHREPGLVGLIGYDEYCHDDDDDKENSSVRSPFYSVICDGIHIDPIAVNFAHKVNSHQMILVTDAMAAMGLEDGVHSLGSMSVDVCGLKATITGTDILAGSVTTMDHCVKSLHKFTRCHIGDAIRAATLNPATVLNIHDRKGLVQSGYDADLVLLDDNLTVLKTWVGGRLVFESK